MKAPNFWHKKNLIAYLVLPLSLLYILASILRNFFIKPTKVKKPIICIGNLTVGGAGKTPVAIAIGNILKELNINFAYLGHGYKSKNSAKNSGLILVDKKVHFNDQVGDEALLLSEISTTFIAENMVSGAGEIAKMDDQKLIIMDDGLQNPSLVKDFSILVIDGNYKFGNNFIFPAGPLRQTPAIGAKNADLIVIIGQENKQGSNENRELAAKFLGKKIIFTKIQPINNEEFINQKLVAFCGIARPSKFFQTLKDCNLEVVREEVFGDHYHYQEKDLKRLMKLALKHQATLITTKKDFVRLDKKYQKQIKYLDIKIDFDQEDQKYLKNKLQKLIDA